MRRWRVSLLRSLHLIKSERRSTRRLSVLPTNLFAPLRILQPDSHVTESAVILLNQPLPLPLTRLLFSRCRHRVCSDGGANRLYDLSCPDLTPDQIIGDMDSVTESVLHHYRDRGTQVVRDTRQDSTDLLKALSRLPNTVTSVYILPPFSGRFDHVLGCVNSLYEWNRMRPSVPAFLISESTLCFLLPAGRNRISYLPGCEDQFCGLVPVGEPASCVTTTGLQWNVRNAELRFGGLISTSNKFGSSEVSVETDNPLLFTSTFEYTSVD